MRGMRPYVGMILVLALTACATAPMGNGWDTELLAKRFSQAQDAYQQGRHAVAAGLLLPLAEKDHPQSLYTLGHMNFYGHGMKQDRNRAIALFRRAAKLGDAKALDALTNLALQGVRAQTVGKSGEKLP